MKSPIKAMGYDIAIDCVVVEREDGTWENHEHPGFSDPRIADHSLDWRKYLYDKILAEEGP